MQALLLFVPRLHNTGFVESTGYTSNGNTRMRLYTTKAINYRDFVPPAGVSSTVLQERCFHLQKLCKYVLS